MEKEDSKIIISREEFRKLNDKHIKMILVKVLCQEIKFKPNIAIQIKLCFQKFKKLVEIDSAFTDMQRFQVCPIHISAVVVVYMHMPYSRKQPFVFGVVKRFGLVMKFRHFRIEGELRVGTFRAKLKKVAYRVVSVANDVFHRQGQTVLL